MGNKSDGNRPADEGRILDTEEQGLAIEGEQCSSGGIKEIEIIIREGKEETGEDPERGASWK